MAFTFVGCASGGDPTTEASTEAGSSEATAAPEATAEPTPTPLPTPEPTPVPVVEIADYAYKSFTNEMLKVGFKYPTHWVNVPGKSTVSYEEPVNPGEIPARVAVTTKSIAKKPSAEDMAAQINAFTDVIGANLENFTAGELQKNIEFIKRNAYHRTYTGVKDGVSVKGFIIITCNTKTKLLFVLHFSTPEARYDAFDPVLKTIVNSVITK